MLVIFTDTDCDFTPSKASEYGYKLISMPYVINDKVIKPYVDFDKFEAHKFYDTLRKGTLPTTCAINPEEYVQYFEPHFKNGDDILYIHFSAAMSGTFNGMNIAVNELKEKYPERKFYTIDTKGITILSYAIANEIGKMFKNGATLEEVLKWSETEVDHFATYFYADDLTFFRRSGRVSGLAGIMGNLIGIHPIIHMDSDGVMKNVDKGRGMKSTLTKIMDKISEIEDDIKGHKIVIGHTDTQEVVNTIISMLKERFGEDLDIEVIDVNPTAGSHCGPNCVGICFHAKHR